jgi:hypothetical protein
MSIISTKEETAEDLQALKEFEDKAAVTVFAATKEQAQTLSAEIADVYEAALGKGGVQKKGHEPYPDTDLFNAKGIKNILEAGERVIAVAQIEEDGKDVVVAAMVADRLSPYHVEFNSMVVPVKRRGHKLASHLVRGLAEIIEQEKFTVNCTELVTHNLASQAAHFHNGFRAISGFGFCHYPHVFFKDHPESVLWVTRLQGKIVPNLRRFRGALGRQLGRHLLDVKQKLIASQASGQVSLASGRLDGGRLDSGRLDTGRLDEESLNLLSEVLKERTAYVPKRYHDLVQSILFQFEDVLDVTVKSWVRPEAPADLSGQEHDEKAEQTKKGQHKGADCLTIDEKEGFGHSYITFKKDFIFDEKELAKAIKHIHKLEKRYIKVCIPANTPECMKAADYLIDQGFVFHSYLPLYGYGEQAQQLEDEAHSVVQAPEFYDTLSLQWIKPSVVKENPLPGETDSVIKLYGYPENLSGHIVRTIAHELEKIKSKD